MKNRWKWTFFLLFMCTENFYKSSRSKLFSIKKERNFSINATNIQNHRAIFFNSTVCTFPDHCSRKKKSREWGEKKKFSTGWNKNSTGRNMNEWMDVCIPWRDIKWINMDVVPPQKCYFSLFSILVLSSYFQPSISACIFIYISFLALLFHFLFILMSIVLCKITPNDTHACTYGSFIFLWIGIKWSMVNWSEQVWT